MALSRLQFTLFGAMNDLGIIIILIFKVLQATVDFATNIVIFLETDIEEGVLHIF